MSINSGLAFGAVTYLNQLTLDSQQSYGYHKITTTFAIEQIDAHLFIALKDTSLINAKYT